MVGEQVKTPVVYARFRQVQRTHDGTDDNDRSVGTSAVGSRDRWAAAPPLSSIAIPLYLSDDRAVLLATAYLCYRVEPQLADVYYQQRAALVEWRIILQIAPVEKNIPNKKIN